jgi:hypothetical protein
MEDLGVLVPGHNDDMIWWKQWLQPFYCVLEHGAVANEPQSLFGTGFSAQRPQTCTNTSGHDCCVKRCHRSSPLVSPSASSDFG